MSEKNKPESKLVKRRGSTGKTVTGNAKGRFTKGNRGGPGRGRRQKRGDLATPPTPAGDPGGAPIAYEEALAQLELARAQLAGVRSELAEALARLARSGAEWSAALRVLEGFPPARRAVLDAVLSPGEAERAPAAGEVEAVPPQPAAAPQAAEGAGVPLPTEKREPEPERTIYDGAKRVPIPRNWGGTIESGRLRRVGVGGIGDPYGDSGPLDSRD